MILRQPLALVRLSVAAALLLAAGTARADVLEIAPGGEARWVAGPIASAHSTAQGLQGSFVPDASPDASLAAAGIPEHAVADTAFQARGVPARYTQVVAQLSARYDLSPALIEALVWQESRWRENAVSHAGARGLAQLMPGTARDLGVNPHDPVANLEGGARYLREQLNRFGGNVELALAAYNAGPGRVMRAGGIPRIAETQDYVARIMGRLSSHSRSNP